MPEVTVFTQPNCSPCRRVKDWFSSKGIEFVERDVTRDTEALAEMRALGFQGTPVVQTSSDAWIGINLEKMKDLL